MPTINLTVPQIRKAFSAFWGSLYGDNARPGNGQVYRHTILTDTKKAVPQYDWQRLLSFGRQLYANLGEVRGPVIEKAMYSVGNAWIPQFYGEDKKWGDLAENWLIEHFKICDVRGEPYDFASDLFLASIAIDRDGDVGLAFVDNGDGYPHQQWIPAHRIGGDEEPITEGSYRGLNLCNGVIFNEFGRAVGYRVWKEGVNYYGNPKSDEYTDISARDMMLVYQPEWHDSGRGITAFAHAIRKIFDIDDIHAYQLIGLKHEASVSLIEHNEKGQYDPGKKWLTERDGISISGLRVEDIEPGVRYFHANSGEKLEAFTSERPGDKGPAFLELILRGAYQGVNWPYEFTRDASKIGGANVRQIIDKVKRSVDLRQGVLGKPATRYTGYAISKAIKIGLLPRSPEWWKWDFQMPEEATVDLGRESQQDRENYKLGMGTLKRFYGKQGLWWVDEADQRIMERKYIERRCKEEGVDIRGVQLLTPNEVAGAEQKPTKPDDE
jgi:hypothetical protein